MRLSLFFLFSLCTVSLPAQTYSGTPFSLSHQFNGNYGFTEIGNTLNYQENFPFPICAIKTSSSATLNLGPNQTVVAAYLYWSGPGSPTGHTTVQLNGNSITSSFTSIAAFSSTVPAQTDIFGCIADVTSIVQSAGNGNYVFSGLNLNNVVNPNGNGSAYCTNGQVHGGWAVLIVYQDLSLLPQQVNIYNGFKVISANNITQITVNLTNLNVTNPTGSKLGFLAWNGTSFVNVQEEVLFNNNVLSNSPLNPVNSPFNSTNSYNNSSTLWNMDLDYFDVSNYLSTGNTQASITIKSLEAVVPHHIVTAIPSELPDATLAINSASVPAPCQGNSLDVSVTLYNTNATAPLPAGTPISFFLDDPAGNPVFAASITTAQPLPIGGSLSLNLTIPVPPGVSGATLLTATANLTQSGQIPVAENNPQNNSDTFPITLPGPPPPPFQPQDLAKCGAPGSTPFDLWNAMVGINTTGFTVGFFRTQAEAQNDQNAIAVPANFTPTNDPQPIFARLTNADGCFTIGGFTLDILELPTVNQPVPLTQCESGPPVGIEQFPINSKIGEITGGNSTYSVSFFKTQILAENGDPNDVLSSPFANTQANSQTIYARVETTEGCFKIVPLELKVVENPDPAQNSVLVERCGENGEAILNLNSLSPEILASLQLPGLGLTFYQTQNDAENGSPEITDPTNFPVTGTATLWVRVENADGCFATVELVLEVDEKPVMANPPENMVRCVEGEPPIFDLTGQNGTVDPQGLYEVKYYASQSDFQNEDPIDNPANFSPSTLPKTVFVALTDPATGCRSDLAGFVLKAAERPEIDLSDFQNQVICVDPITGEPLPGQAPIILDTGLSAVEYEFTWKRDGNTLTFNGPALEINEAGVYSVEVVPINGIDCPATASVTIEKSSAPLFELRQPGDFGSLVVEVVDIQGFGDYEFSIDGVNFIPATGGKVVFQGLPGGEITVIGRDKNGCRQTVKSILLLAYPKFFTPNGDGINDRWNIRSLAGRPGTVIRIFDRFGKLLGTIAPVGPGWDGTYNGKRMPSNDYWFQLKYPAPDGNIKIFTNNFTLKR